MIERLRNAVRKLVDAAKAENVQLRSDELFSEQGPGIGIIGGDYFKPGWIARECLRCAVVGPEAASARSVLSPEGERADAVLRALRRRPGERDGGKGK